MDMQPNYGYSKSSNGDVITYAVASEQLKATPFIFVGVVVFLGFIIAGQSWLFGLIAGIATWYGLGWLQNMKRRRPQEFSLSRQGVSKDGRNYAWEHVTNILLTNPANNATNYNASASGGGFIVGGTGMAGVGIASAMAVGQGLNRLGAINAQAAYVARANKSWRLQIRFGSETVTLIDYMSEPVGSNLFDDVVKASQGLR